MGAFFLVGILVLAANLYRLMVVRHDEFLSLSVANQFKDVRVRAPRGQIKDRRGEILVDVRPSFDVSVTPAFCLRCSTDVLPVLAEVLQWDEAQRTRIEGLLKAAHGPQRYQPMAVAVDLAREELDTLATRLYQLPGVDLDAVPHRHYRAGAALAHVLGYMNEISQEELAKGAGTAERSAYALGDYIGRRGVERAWENSLRGKDGWQKEVVNARGEVMRDMFGNVMRREESAPQPGNNVILSIDARLQAEAERLFPGVAGSMVVVEAKTGFLLAVVSRPAYDPNVLTGRVSPAQLAALSKDPMQPLVFRAAQEHYHPGSTFKVVTLLAALRSGAFTPHTVTNCPGGYRLGARTWRCHKESGHGPMDARDALQKSCDTYFYRVADTLGIDPIAEEGRAFGLGVTAGIEFAAEVPGVMPDSAYHDRTTPGGYQKGMALNTAIGQGDVNVTPLQLAMLYAAVGNGGALYQPQVVRRVESPEGQVLEEYGPKKVRQIEMTSDQHLLIVDALKAVVNEAGGTAFRTRLKDVVVAGKTGTAQVARLGVARLKKEQMDYWQRDHAWFAAFAPADDPEIAVVVLNEHGGHGGVDAAPAASGIIEKFFELKRGDGTAFGPDWSAPPPREAPPAPPPPGPPLVPPQQEPAGLALGLAPDAGLPINLAGSLPAPP